MRSSTSGPYTAYSTRTVRLVDVEVEPGLSLGECLYSTEEDSPALPYFYGNGEIAAYCDDIAPLHRRLGITLLVMDYHGFDHSGGQLLGSFRALLFQWLFS